MTPGKTLDMVDYDGKMLNLVFQHGALVERGRAGPDVFVGDSAMLKSRAALIAQGSIAAYLAPKMAKGQTLAMDAALKDVTRANLKAQAPKIAAAIAAAAKGKLAKDEMVDTEVLSALVEAAEGMTDADSDGIAEQGAKTEGETADEGEGGSKVDQFKAMWAGMSDEEKAACRAAMGGSESDKPAADKTAKDGDKVDKTAMDAALRTATQTARADALKEMAAIRTAEREVRPVVGEVTVACDSAAAVYKVGLDHYKADLTGIPEAAYGPMYRALASHAVKLDEPAPLASDAASDDFLSRFKGAAAIRLNA